MFVNVIASADSHFCSDFQIVFFSRTVSSLPITFSYKIDPTYSKLRWEKWSQLKSEHAILIRRSRGAFLKKPFQNPSINGWDSQKSAVCLLFNIASADPESNVKYASIWVSNNWDFRRWVQFWRRKWEKMRNWEKTDKFEILLYLRKPTLV